MLISVVIRTLNEEKYLEQLLSAIQSQNKEGFDIEIVIIDSGSTPCFFAKIAARSSEYA